MQKINYRQVLSELYNPPRKVPAIVDVPSMNFLMIDGQGDPNTTKEYQEAIQTLYPVAFGVKFALKKAGLADYVVLPLEGLWWVDDMAEWSMDRRDEWKWTIMIMQPSPVTEEYVDRAVEEVKLKKPVPALSKLRFEPYHEGLSVQIMYFGPFAEEGPTIEKLHEFARDQGYELRGKHHEIYLSDPRRTAAAKLKTIIRQPIK